MTKARTDGGAECVTYIGRVCRVLRDRPVQDSGRPRAMRRIWCKGDTGGAITEVFEHVQSCGVSMPDRSQLDEANDVVIFSRHHDLRAIARWPARAGSVVAFVWRDARSQQPRTGIVWGMTIAVYVLAGAAGAYRRGKQESRERQERRSRRRRSSRGRCRPNSRASAISRRIAVSTTSSRAKKPSRFAAMLLGAADSRQSVIRRDDEAVRNRRVAGRPAVRRGHGGATRVRVRHGREDRELRRRERRRPPRQADRRRRRRPRARSSSPTAP